MQVSVVIPTYNRASDLRRAVESVLSQTLPVAEIIVVDDGSTDNTREVVAEFGGKLRYIRQDNAGAAAARNVGVRAATAEWIAFLDSDDWWLPQKIQLQVKALESNPRAALAYTSAWVISPEGERTMVRAADPVSLWPALRHSNLLTSTSCVMARRDAVVEEGGFDEALFLSEDWDLWIRIARKHPFAMVPEPVTVYMVTPGSLSMDPEKTLADMEHMMEATLLCGLRGVARLVWRRKIRAAQLFRAALIARDRNPVCGRNLLMKSLAKWPSPFFFAKRWKALANYILGRDNRIRALPREREGSA